MKVSDLFKYRQPEIRALHLTWIAFYIWAVAGAECNTVIELKPEHHAASPWHFA